VRVLGEDVLSCDLVALRRRIGYVIQEGGLLPHLDVLDNVGLVPRLLGWPESRRVDRGMELLRLVQLDADAVRGRRPADLSGGERQRVGVARALAAHPPLLLMDEPFGALDAMTREQMNLELQRIWRESGKTVILITHSIPEAIFLGDVVLVMTARPGTLKRVIPVGLPRPRDMDVMASPEFARIAHEIRALFHHAGTFD
jgi:NitT/TauT family transport system ATP-binding protein